MHNLGVARFYYDARYKGHKGGLKGAQSRLKEILDKYPHFSLTDEVLFRLGTTYQQEEEPDEAAKHYQNLVRNYPNSEFLEKAKEQLSIIGAAVPDADPARKNVMPAEKPGFVGDLIKQFAGKADISVSPDGVLISKDKKEGKNDLMDEAIKYNGTLPTNVMPQAPVQRRNRPATSQAPPSTSKNTTPASSSGPATPKP